MIKNGLDIEKEAALQIADLMAVAARTAPKGCGIDNLEIRIVDDYEKDTLAEEMKRLGVDAGIDFFIRDGNNMDTAFAALLIGVRTSPIFCPNCGLCGYKDCEENIAHSGICVFNTTDLGIALGSAVSIASAHKIDNRILFTAGKAALSLGYFPPEVKVAFGIPLSISSKSPFFDRAETAADAK